MKNLFFAVIISFAVPSYSQDFLPVDFPIKVKYTESGHTYLTGKSLNGMIFIKKYLGVNQEWTKEFISPFSIPDDRGVDVVIDSEANVYVTGYVYDDSYDILRKVVLKYDEDGIHQWATIFDDNDEESSGISIFVDEDDNVYSCGFITDNNGGVGRNYYVQKLDDWGGILWTYEYDDLDFHGNDVATSLLVDENFIYVMGYSYRGSTNLNDIALVCLDKDNGVIENNYPEIYSRAGSNEYPTDFIFVEDFTSDRRKTKTSSITGADNINIPNSSADYITLFFDGGLNSNLLWASIFDGGATDVPLSINLADDGNILVTGYSYNSETEYDYATIKYNKDNGNGMWQTPAYIFDNQRGNDKGTSVLAGNEVVYVSGYSEAEQLGFYTIAYNDFSSFNSFSSGSENIRWKDKHTPGFSKNMRNDKKSYAFSTLDSNGNIIITGVISDSNGFRYSMFSYDREGRKRYAYEDDGRNYRLNTKIEIGLEKISTWNYPNPFNPVTKIYFTIPNENNVSVKLFNSLGQLVSEILNDRKSSGTHFIEFNASHLSSGVYYYQIKAGDFFETKKIMLLK